MNPEDVPDHVSLETWERWQVWMTAKAAHEVWTEWHNGNTKLTPGQEKLFNWPVGEGY